jgi:hypothetical protein
MRRSVLSLSFPINVHPVQHPLTVSTLSAEHIPRPGTITSQTHQSISDALVVIVIDDSRRWSDSAANARRAWLNASAPTRTRARIQIRRSFRIITADQLVVAGDTRWRIEFAGVGSHLILGLTMRCTLAFLI